MPHTAFKAENVAVSSLPCLPLLTLPLVRGRKWIRNERCLRCSRGLVVHAPRLRNGIRLQANMRPAREASFVHFPFFATHKRAPEGQVCGRLSFAYLFFGEAKKSKWPPGHPRPASTKCNRYQILHYNTQKPTANINPCSNHTPSC